jgi:hypothetical protein
MAASKDKKAKTSAKAKAVPKKGTQPKAKLMAKPKAPPTKPAPTKTAPLAKLGNAKTAAPAPVLTKGKQPKAPTVAETSGKKQLKRTGRSVARAMAHSAEAAGYNICREIACESSASSGGYCRLHYIKNWKKIKRKELILKEGKLNQYIEELVAKYPDKYIEAIKQDLSSDKEFGKVVHDLELEEGIDDFEGDGENVEAIIDGIKREYDDEDVF